MLAYTAMCLTWPEAVQIYWSKESFYMWKEFNSHRTARGHQYGCRFKVWGHHYGGCDVYLWKASLCKQKSQRRHFTYQSWPFSPKILNSFKFPKLVYWKTWLYDCQKDIIEYKHHRSFAHKLESYTWNLSSCLFSISAYS